VFINILLRYTLWFKISHFIYYCSEKANGHEGTVYTKEERRIRETTWRC